MVAEAAPGLRGHRMARELAESGIDTTLVTDAALFAVMARVSKVVIGTRAVLADGGLVAASGSHALALAAKHHAVPLIVCAALFKFSAQYAPSCGHVDSIGLAGPAEVLEPTDELAGRAQVYNPSLDYVPPDLVTLFVSNMCVGRCAPSVRGAGGVLSLRARCRTASAAGRSGSHAASYVYRLLRDLYHPADTTLA